MPRTNNEKPIFKYSWCAARPTRRNVAKAHAAISQKAGVKRMLKRIGL